MFVIDTGLFLLTLIVMAYSMAYGCMSAGHSFGKHRIAASAGIFILFYTFISVLFSYVTRIPTLHIGHLYIPFLPYTIFMLAVSAALLFSAGFFLSRRLNLR
ncbi:MAG: hypothetical protein ACI4SS_02490 [Clostridia bacterium]